jgi:hypothetical protein
MKIFEARDHLDRAMENGLHGHLLPTVTIVVTKRETETIHDHATPIFLCPEIVNAWKSGCVRKHFVKFEFRAQLTGLNFRAFEFNRIEIPIVNILDFKDRTKGTGTDLTSDLVFRVENVANFGVSGFASHRKTVLTYYFKSAQKVVLQQTWK